MSSNPLMMGYGGGDLTACCWLLVAGDRATARSLCVQAVGGGLSGLAAQFSGTFLNIGRTQGENENV